MDVVPGEEHSHPSTTPSRCAESYSRHGVKIHEGSIRLETRSTAICEYQLTLRTTGSGPICNQADQSMPSLLQLAARSICRGNRCISPGLEKHEGVCQPTMEPDISCSDENTNAGSRCGSGGPSMEGSTMVCPPIINAGRLATLPTQAINQSSPRVRDNTPGTPIGRMEHLRERLSGQGLSGQATDLILKSWRTKTNKSYDSLFGRWSRWCTERNSDPFSGPVSEVANFLAVLYQEGYQYNTMNAYRSAISSVHRYQ